VLVPVVAHADVEGAPFADAAMSYDDNVFRFADESEALAERGSTQMSDLVTRLDAGAEVRGAWGLQKGRLRGVVQRFRYQDFDELDRTESELGGRWEWELGLPLAGELGYQQSRRLESFTSRDTPVTDIGFVDQRVADVLAGVAVAPRWQVKARAADLQRRFTSSASQTGDLTETRAGAGIDYHGEPIGTAGMEFSVAHGDFPRRTASSGTGLAQSYRQYDYDVRAGYAPSAVSLLKAEGGYTRWVAAGVGARDFSGATGTLSLERTWSTVTKLDVELQRRLQPVEEPDANVVERTGATASLRVKPDVTLTWMAQALVALEDYRGAATLAPGGADRRDRVRGFEASLLYEPRTWVAITPGVRYEIRDSTRAVRAYRDTIFSLAFEVRYD
jgi:hypothetical protein